MVLIIQTAVCFVFAILSVYKCPFSSKVPSNIGKINTIPKSLNDVNKQHFQNKSSPKIILSEYFDMTASVYGANISLVLRSKIIYVNSHSNYNF